MLPYQELRAEHKRKVRKRNFDEQNENINVHNTIAIVGTTSQSPSSNVNITNPSSSIYNDANRIMYYNNAREKRKFRKLYLDNKKSRNMSTTSQQLNSSTSHVVNMKENGRLSPCQNSSLQSPFSNTNVRTPLSNITNAIYNDNNVSRTPVSNIRKYSQFSTGMTSTNSSIITQRSSLIKLPSGRPRLQRRTIDISTIPTFDLTTDEHIPSSHNVEDVPIGISKDYLDHGDQNVICEMCNAKLWMNECVRGKNHSNKSYSLCCGYGKVELPEFKEAPISYQQLFRSTDPKSKYFMKNIRRYNSMFSFTSMGGKVDSSINRGNAPYIFRLSGQNYHSIGSLLPANGDKPQFCQLYIYDTENEASNRQSIFGVPKDTSTSTSCSFDMHIIEELKVMLDSNNELVKCYRRVRDCYQSNPNVDLKLRLIGKRNQDGREYNLPTASEVAALIVGDMADYIENRDIVVHTVSGSQKRISELHPSYLPLQYPLLFPYGDDGYRVDILHRGVSSSTNTKRSHCTMKEFFAYRIQDRVNVFSLIMNSKRLFQQFLVDAYTMIESERLFFIRRQQNIIRCETFENLRKVQNAGDTSLSNIGQRVILPSSFTGGERYKMQNYLDAMALCKFFGYPDFFITVTCNPKWPEIQRFLKNTTLRPEDRPDILCRLFKIKLDSLIKDIKEKAIFGKVQAVVYTIEFQKRGLPHSHICVFMHSDHKLPTVELIDPIISAEIPNRNEDPELYSLVNEFMIHGPCGGENMNCPCMVDNKCSKIFPKKFRDQTSIDENGFPLYRRRDDGSFVEKSSVRLDNRNVVPYNKYLLKRYQAHINVEWCNQSGSIKYLFKYINKGPDRATVALVRDNDEHDNEEPIDEIKKFYDCRYISACEATWRIFGYDVHYRTPSVVRLPFHLPGQQQIVYGADDDVDDVLNKSSVASSMFLSWMKCNEEYEEAKNLNYVEFPTKFVWKINKRCWEPRKKGFSIGRIHSVSPNVGEAYFLRILLNKVKGAKSFEDILTVNGEICPTFRDACYALGLLDDDSEYIEAIKEASHSGSGYYLRSLFSTMLMTNTLSRPDFVWSNTWEYLADGILYKQQIKLKSPDLSLTDDQLKNLTLFEIESILLRNNSSLKNFAAMPYPDDDLVSSSNNRLITEELDYDKTSVQQEFDELYPALTNEQRQIFEDIITSVNDNNGGLFFVYGYGGTGKTFLWKTLSAAIRSKGQIVLNVASSGIASLLLTGGRTAHSRFHIPLNVTEDSVCYIKPDNDLSCLIKKTKLIIWDEAPMVNKHAFEALDRTMKDILSCYNSNNLDLPFGGKVIVFGGDFRQILPVVQNGSRQDIVNASLSSSYIWSKCKIRNLTKNMRLTVGSDSRYMDQTKKFADWLLDIGEGKVGGSNDGDATIDIPEDLLITESYDPIGSLIEFVYTSILENIHNQNFFSERAILAPKNDVVQEINDRLLAFFPGQEKEYLSSDSICQSESVQDKVDPSLYSPDVLNGLKISGMPNHNLMYLKNPVFTHGQLYVALSRVKSRKGLKIVILDKDGRLTNKTTNVVYKEVFEHLC